MQPDLRQTHVEQAFCASDLPDEDLKERIERGTDGRWRLGRPTKSMPMQHVEGELMVVSLIFDHETRALRSIQENQAYQEPQDKHNEKEAPRPFQRLYARDSS